MKEVIIGKNDSGIRLDRFLEKYLDGMPRALLYKSIRKKCVRINGRRVTDAETVLCGGDRLALYIKEEFLPKDGARRVSEFENIAKRPNVVFEDENILVAYKPKGLDCHGGEDNLIDRIRAYLFEKGEYDPSKENTFSPALSNRLDRNTEGLVIAAKNAAALRDMNARIKNREVKKLYECTAEGIFEKKSGVIESWMIRRGRDVRVYDEPVPGAKKAVTGYKVISEKNGKSRVLAELLTGRTHQIRAQLAHIGHPLEGDVRYGGHYTGRYQELKCSRIEFRFSRGGLLSYLDGTVIEA